jgi:hypothetical protein
MSGNPISIQRQRQVRLLSKGAENRRPAKFRIAATLATQIDPAAASEDALWAELDRLTPIFLGRWQAIRAGGPLPATADGRLLPDRPPLIERKQERDAAQGRAMFMMPEPSARPLFFTVAMHRTHP